MRHFVVLTAIAILGMSAPALAATAAPPSAAPSPTATAGATGGLPASAATATAPAATATQDVIIKSMPGIVVDTKAREVRLEAHVCLTKGLLELLACAAGTKEHESIFSVKAKPSQVTYALFLLGLEPGVPGQALDRGIYRPPAGELVDITVRITFPNGSVQEMPAWKLLRLTGSEVPVDRPINWVYVGVPTPAARSAADAEGTVICLSNFVAAVIDVPFESTSTNADLNYEINPATVPPVGTAAELIIRPTGRRTEPKKMVTEIIVRKDKPLLLDGQEVDLEKFRQTVTRMPADIRLALLKVDPGETFGRALQLYTILTDDALMTVRMSVLEPGEGPAAVGTAPLAVTVTADGHVRLGPQEWTLEEFRPQAPHVFKGARSVDVIAEPKAPPAAVTEVLSAARQAGATVTLVPGGKDK